MSRTTKSQNAIEKHFMLAFAGNLKRKGAAADESLMDIQDLDTSNPIYQVDLPTTIPLVIRQRIVALSKQQAAITKQIEDMLGQLETVAEKIYDEWEEQQEAAKPHCKSCGQVLSSKKPRYGAGQTGM